MPEPIHLAVPMVNDPMFWARLDFASIASTIVLLAAIVWFAKQTLKVKRETTIIKWKIRRIKYGF